MSKRLATVADLKAVCGEDLPDTRALECLKACSFDLSEAINYYFDSNRNGSQKRRCDVSVKPGTTAKVRKIQEPHAQPVICLDDDENSAPSPQSSYGRVESRKNVPIPVAPKEETSCVKTKSTERLQAPPMPKTRNSKDATAPKRPREAPKSNTGSQASEAQCSTFKGQLSVHSAQERSTHAADTVRKSTGGVERVTAEPSQSAILGSGANRTTPEPPRKPLAVETPPPALIPPKTLWFKDTRTSGTVVDPSNLASNLRLKTDVVITASQSKRKSRRQSHTLPLPSDALTIKLLEDNRSTGMIRLGKQPATSGEKIAFVAKLQSRTTQVLWPLLAVEFIQLFVKTDVSPEGEIYEFGESIPLRLWIGISPKAFRYSVKQTGLLKQSLSSSSLGDKLSPTAQSRLRDAMIELFASILCLQPARASLLTGTADSLEAQITKLVTGCSTDEGEDEALEYSQESLQKTHAVFDQQDSKDLSTSKKNSGKALPENSAPKPHKGTEVDETLISGLIDIPEDNSQAQKITGTPVSPSPEVFKGTLRRYQAEALGWMYMRENADQYDTQLNGRCAQESSGSRENGGIEKKPCERNQAQDSETATSLKPVSSCISNIVSEHGDNSGKPETERITKPQGLLKLNPLWDEYASFGTTGDWKYDKLYLNRATGEVSLRCPPFENDCKGGILADEMGLGKTIQMIGLMAYDLQKLYEDQGKIEEPRKSNHVMGGTLIVVPLSLMGQWRAEIDRYLVLPPKCRQSVRCAEYYGALRSSEKSTGQLATCAVVLTTYATISADYAKRQSHEGLPFASLGTLWQIRWRRIVLDECHNIRNRETRQTRAITTLLGDRKWCLSGTPIQNSLEDLFPLFQFLSVHPWDQWVWWNRFISTPLSKGLETQATMTVRRITGPLILRRTKKTIDPSTGKPIVSLPPINIVNIAVPMSSNERMFYDFLFQKSKTEFDAYVHLGIVGKNYTHILALLLKLRQACCHPFLALSNSGIKDAKTFSVLESMICKYQMRINNTKLSREFVETQLAQWKTGSVSECVVCQDDEAMDPVASLACCHAMCRECAISSVKALASCPVCRVPMSLKTLVGFPRYTSLYGEARTNLLRKFVNAKTELAATNTEPSIGSFKKDSSNQDCKVSINATPEATVLSDVEHLPPECDDIIIGCDSDATNGATDDERDPDMSSKLEALADSPVAAPQADSQNCGIPTDGSATFSREGFELSSKLHLLRDMLSADVVNRNNVVVFSQWTSFLDLIEEMFKRPEEGKFALNASLSSISWQSSKFTSDDADNSDFGSRIGAEVSDGTGPPPGMTQWASRLPSDWKYRRLDGTMTLKERNDIINWFLYEDKLKNGGQILLCSLAVGGVGLNLVTAAHVYILDPWWNPAMEAQAYQRVYRIGQTREVFVYRFIMNNSVEKSILDLHEKKSQKADSVLLHSTASKEKKKTLNGLEDLKEIFNLRHG